MEQPVWKQQGYNVEIVYMAKDGTLTKRKIKVVSCNRNSVNGYCYLRHQMRSFLKENILAAHPKLPTSSHR
ncbi:hypothetical protein N780_12135 [Pontibacillus chungwhensis BH030062]|uniref:WYL domain-containing protein n=1 Tax=Pontibacillus chungwhensis BH030062 TaxID=1385513 RepID=A0A0A2V2M3_9BACI|nr:hypothetical protein [Pontibacillus chungwhensis]KGP93066.1 hypothetical protein N780_12135 [Pontibacillus chungwhensis BH030062]